MSIFSRLAEVRARTGLSQADFARKVGVGKSTQIRYEKGEVWPAVDYLERVASVFREYCDYNWLATGMELTAAETLTAAIATVLTRLSRSIGIDDSDLMTVREACQLQDSAWQKLLDAALQRAGVTRLEKDEKELLENYRAANADGKLAIRLTGEGIAARSKPQARNSSPRAAALPDYGLKPDELALLDNYRNSSEKSKDSIKRTAFTFAKQKMKGEAA
jgi:transcriptional regulator with XRE-family HTH domain